MFANPQMTQESIDVEPITRNSPKGKCGRVGRTLHPPRGLGGMGGLVTGSRVSVQAIRAAIPLLQGSHRLGEGFLQGASCSAGCYRAHGDGCPSEIVSAFHGLRVRASQDSGWRLRFSPED